MSETSEQQAAQVIKSHMCVVLFDACPGPNEDPLAVWARLKIFINAYVSKSRRNFAAIVLYGTEGVQVCGVRDTQGAEQVPDAARGLENQHVRGSLHLARSHAEVTVPGADTVALPVPRG